MGEITGFRKARKAARKDARKAKKAAALERQAQLTEHHLYDEEKTPSRMLLERIGWRPKK